MHKYDENEVTEIGVECQSCLYHCCIVLFTNYIFRSLVVMLFSCQFKLCMLWHCWCTSMTAGQDNISSKRVGRVGHIHHHMVHCVLSFIVTLVPFWTTSNKDLLAGDIFCAGFHSTAKYRKMQGLKVPFYPILCFEMSWSPLQGGWGVGWPFKIQRLGLMLECQCPTWWWCSVSAFREVPPEKYG